MGDTRSHQNEQRQYGLMPYECNDAGGAVSEDELEMANQLANEASLGFGDLYSLMHHTKSKKSQHAERTLMSAVDAEFPP